MLKYFLGVEVMSKEAGNFVISTKIYARYVISDREIGCQTM